MSIRLLTLTFLHSGGLAGRLRERRPREEFAVFLLVEPRALDVEEPEARHQARERERIDHELSDRLIGARVGFVIEDMHRAIPHLQEVHVAGGTDIYRFADDRA